MARGDKWQQAEEAEHDTRQPKRYPPFMLTILVFDLQTDKCVRSYVRDFNLASTRKWVHRLVIWAANNKSSVELLSQIDDELLGIANDQYRAPARS